MPRVARNVAPDSVVHVVNRGVDKRLLFDGPRDYQEFLEIVDRAYRRTPGAHTRLRADAEPLALRPVAQYERAAIAVSALCDDAACRTFSLLVRHDRFGHVYQGRYRSSTVAGDVRYVRTLRYVEGNALRAALVQRAEDWPWCSLAERIRPASRIVDGPVPLPHAEAWMALVNAPDVT